MENTQTTTPTTTTSEDNSLESSMMDMFNAATEEVPQETKPQETQPQEPQPQEAKPDERARDESGKFVKKDEAAPEPAEPAAQPDALQQPAGQPVEAQPAELRPPSSWSATAKSEFAKLNPVVQREVAKREEDFHRGIEQYREGYQQFQTISQVVSPYIPIIQAKGGTPLGVIQNLLNVAYQMETNPAETLLKLARQRGVDLSQYFNGQEEQQPVDPNVQALQQQVGQLQSHIAQGQQQQMQYARAQQVAVEQQADTEINAFASDQKNVYFHNVRQDMAILLKEGRAKDMQDAYDKACWQNPEIRQILLQQQLQAGGNKRIEEARQKAANAKRAGFDVVGQGSVAAGDRQLSLEDDLMSRYNSTST